MTSKNITGMAQFFLFAVKSPLISCFLIRLELSVVPPVGLELSMVELLMFMQNQSGSWHFMKQWVSKSTFLNKVRAKAEK